MARNLHQAHALRTFDGATWRAFRPHLRHFVREHMKSYLLAPVSSLEAARQALDDELTGQRNPWLLKSATGDPIAYFNVADEHEGGREYHIFADVSGRHYNEDDAVLRVLKKVQGRVGGRIKCSP